MFRTCLSFSPYLFHFCSCHKYAYCACQWVMARNYVHLIRFKLWSVKTQSSHGRVYMREEKTQCCSQARNKDSTRKKNGRLMYTVSVPGKMQADATRRNVVMFDDQFEKVNAIKERKETKRDERNVAARKLPETSWHPSFYVVSPRDRRRNICNSNDGKR